MEIRIGTRQSKLALIQTGMVVAKINKYFPEINCLVVPIVTTGDKITDKNLYDIGGKALFLKEIEEQLFSKQIDIAVHSLKDVPGILPEGLEIAAVLEREDPRDCFVSFKHKSLYDLPPNAKVGSSSVRRKVIMRSIRPDLEIVPFRGNINTRLEKLKNEEVEATILACAGLHRASLFNPDYCFPIEPEIMLPAAGQGVIGIEIRSDDQEARRICLKVNDAQTSLIAKAERNFLSYLDASCRTPMSAYATLEKGIIKASYMLSNITGSQMEFLERRVPQDKAEVVGVEAARKLKKLFANYEQEVLGIEL